MRMARKAPSTLDVHAIIHDYDEDRRKIIEARTSGRHGEAQRLTDAFHQKQRLRADRATRKADPEDARVFLVVLATQLRDGWQPHYDVRKYLHDALIEAAKNPAKATSALGLVLPRRRPPSTEYRDITIAFRVLDLSESRPINTSANNSAIEVAAQEHDVSIAVAERAWKRHGRSVKGWREAMDAGK